MSKTLKKRSGSDTLFTDKAGKPIKVHDYVKDAEGNRYYINSYCQAVPEDDGAPAEELSKLVERTDVFVLGIEEVLDMKKPVEHKRRGGRRRKEEDMGSHTSEEAQAEAEARKAAEEAIAKARDKEEFEAAEKARKAAAAAAGEGTMNIHPVTEEMILSVLPDDVLANELRRRGYTLCAVRPALIEL